MIDALKSRTSKIQSMAAINQDLDVRLTEVSNLKSLRVKHGSKATKKIIDVFTTKKIAEIK